MFRNEENQTLSQMLEGKISNDPPIYIYPPQNSINYTELGIFISGLILSVGGKREDLDIPDN